MRPTVVWFLIFGGCLLLELNKCSRQICPTDHYTVTWSNNSFKDCLKCAKCHPGLGLYPKCGSSVTHPVKGIGCIPCVNGKTFSNDYNSAPCISCHGCAKHEIVAANCIQSSDTKCNGTCIQGYYYTKKPRHDCLRCSYCCFDGKDEIQQECVNQGLNTVKQHCSHRMDKTCGPNPTTMITPETQLPAHSTPANRLATHHSQPTNQGQAKVAMIVSSVAVGLLFAVIVVGAILCMRRMRKIQRRRGSKQPPMSVAMNVNGTLATEDQTPENESNHVEQSVPRRLQALQNEGCSIASTPQGSPGATPHQTDDELDELPDVSTRPPRKHPLKRQNSKEAQNAQKDVAEDSEASGRNEGHQDSKGAEGGHQRKRSRSGSIQEVIRKLSHPGGTNYQILPAEDPDQIPAENDIAGDSKASGRNEGQQDSKGTEGGLQRKHSRSGSIQGILKRKLSFQGGTDYQRVAAEDPDQIPGNSCESSLGESAEPLIIKEHSKSQKQTEGSQVEFKCEVQGRKEVSYQWYKDGTKLQGQNSPILVLNPVKLHDFGCYTCEVKSIDGQCVESFPTALDVTPGDGMRLKCLTEVFKNSLDDQEKVQKLLVRNITGAGGWKHIACKYKMDLLDVNSLEGSQDAGARVVDFLKAQNPELTVYDFCKTLKEPNIRRLDIVKVLSHFPWSEPHSY